MVRGEKTILDFKHLLERHRLTEAVFAEVGALLAIEGSCCAGARSVDATIIEDAGSTKNAARKRDPQMTQTRKRSSWHFGMKAHGLPLVHTAGIAASLVRRLAVPRCLSGDRRIVLTAASLRALVRSTM